MATKNIAVFMGGLQYDSQRKLVDGIWKRVEETGDRIFLFACDTTADKKYNEGELKVFSIPNLNDFDGVIFYSETIYDEEIRLVLIEEIRRLNIPCVTVGLKYSDIVCVSDDNWDVMQQLIDSVLNDRAVKTVNYIAGQEHSRDDMARRNACRDALARYGVSLCDERIYYGDYTTVSGRKAIEHFADEKLLDADIYVCSNDQMAIGAYYALLQEGIRVPEDTMLTGFDNIFLARNHTPRITSVARDERLLGKTAYETLLKIISGEYAGGDVLIQNKVVLAQSTGHAQGLQDEVNVALNHYAHMKIQSDRYSELVTDVTAMMTGTQTFDELSNVISKYAARLECDEFYMVLNDNSDFEQQYTDDDLKNTSKEQETTDFTENMNNVLTIKAGALHGKKIIKRWEIIPGGVNAGKKGAFYVISPLHYQNRCYGYSVICNSKLPMENRYYHIFVTSLSNALERVRTHTQLQNMIKHLDEVWIYDSLTHIYNRSGFLKFADSFIEISQLAHKQLVIFFLDLDHLKSVNDELGHDMGDLMIKTTADILSACKRPDELIMRYGGDEFVILGRGYDDAEAKKYVEEIHAAMKKYSEDNNLGIPLEASIGYSIVDSNISEPLTSLIKIADQKMYEIKREKRLARI